MTKKARINQQMGQNNQKDQKGPKMTAAVMLVQNNQNNQKIWSPHISHTILKVRFFWDTLYLQTICTAGNGGKNVVGVHRPQDELAPVPELEALLVATLQPRGPALQAAHAHRRQVALPTLRLHLGR